VLERFSNVDVPLEKVERVLTAFIGVQQQIPPIYSAIKLDGKRAHALARSGVQVEMVAREVEVKDIQMLSFEYPILTLRVSCTKGTYIRSLARDIGHALGVGGCVTMLRRVSSGGWPEQMMVSLEELEEKKEACIIPLQTWLRDLDKVELKRDEASRFVQGQRLSRKARSEKWAEKNVELCQVFFEDVMLGTASVEARDSSSILQPQRVLPSAQEIFR